MQHMNAPHEVSTGFTRGRRLTKRITMAPKLKPIVDRKTIGQVCHFSGTKSSLEVEPEVATKGFFLILGIS